MNVQAYLQFGGHCDEAIEFYKKALGAEVVMLTRFKECPDPNMPGMDPAMAEKVMHASLKIGESTVMMSDGRCEETTKFDGFSLTIGVGSDAEAARLFAALGDGGKVIMPLGKTFFASSFGMLSDRFGLHWMIIAGG